MFVYFDPIILLFSGRWHVHLHVSVLLFFTCELDVSQSRDVCQWLLEKMALVAIGPTTGHRAPDFLLG